MGTFVISKRQNGYYKYEFTSRKGKVIFTSADFELRFECEEAIERLKTNVDQLVFMKFKTSKGKLYFKIILNDKEIATSRKYSTVLLLEKGICDVKKYAPLSEYLDFSNQFFEFPN
ncbi:MAG: DUF1508 domain-containing protein [Flavobacterium sp.]|nr:DUF1508 domain-containing protein [Flavobacterium sp.]